MEEAKTKILRNRAMNKKRQNQPDNSALWGLFFTSKSAVGRLRSLELSEIGVTPEQSGALQLLMFKDGKSSIAEMTHAWLRQKNSVSTLVDRMSKKGLVRKIKKPRQKDLEIEITPKGRELYDKIKDTSHVFDMVFAELSAEDKNRFASYLRLVLKKSRQILLDREPR